jgi:hypothetical protein
MSSAVSVGVGADWRLPASSAKSNASWSCMMPAPGFLCVIQSVAPGRMTEGGGRGRSDPGDAVHLVCPTSSLWWRSMLGYSEPCPGATNSTLSQLYYTPKVTVWRITCTSMCYVRLMARPYGDPVEIVTEPIPAQSPFIPTDAKIVVGAVAPASPDPIPIVLLPGFEYRIREWRHPNTPEVHWRLERRKSAQHGDDDE